MPKNTGRAIFKPYNIVLTGKNDAEVSLYGEVVSTRPTDWWTGESVPGNFIALDEFLKDLDDLESKDNITIHINSVGGDLYAGIAIFNRLKGLSSNIITINDGLAASAGSIIFMAGDTRKVNAGSNLMIHGAVSFIYGWYQIQDIKAADKALTAHNKAAINIYAERTGIAAADVKVLIEDETWMTGQEAVDAGFAHEVIGDESEPVEMSLTPDRSMLVVNGYSVAARCFGKLPDGIQVMTVNDVAASELTAPEPDTINMQPAPQDDINNQTSGGTKHMEINNMDELRAAYPDLLAQVETAAQVGGVAAERERIRGIEEIEAAIGDPELVNSAKFGEKPMNAEQLAFAAMKAQAAIGANVLGNLETDAKNSGSSEVKTKPITVPELTEDEKATAFLVGMVNKKKEG